MNKVNVPYLTRTMDITLGFNCSTDFFNHWHSFLTVGDCQKMVASATKVKGLREFNKEDGLFMFLKDKIRYCKYHEKSSTVTQDRSFSRMSSLSYTKKTQ